MSIVFENSSWPFFKISMPMIIGYSTGYSTIFLLSLIGNIIVILTVVRNKSMHTVINYFICNLSIADLLCAIFVLPITLFQTLLSEWRMGEFLCRTTPYLQGVAVCASVATLTIVAFDRFQAICFPLKRIINKSRANFIILAIWICSFILLSPWAAFYRLNQEIEINQTKFANHSFVAPVYCYQKWPDKSDGMHFFIGVNFIACYILPLVLISGFYTAIAVRLWRRLSRSSKSGGDKDCRTIRLTNTSGGVDRDKSVKVIMMLVTVVSLFAISWLPLYSIFIALMSVGKTWSKQTSDFVTSYMIPLFQLLGASNTCVNPWIYCLYSKKYRESFKNIILCRRVAFSQNYINSKTNRLRLMTINSTQMSRLNHNECTKL